MKINFCISSACSMMGYVYEVKDTTGAFIGWLPFDTTLSKAQFEYTVLTHNPLATGAEKISKPSSSISLYPNPSSEQNYITFTVEGEQNVEIVLFNSSGIKVGDVFRGKSSVGYNQVISDVNNLPSGFYIYKVRLGNKIENISFIKF